MKNKFTNKYKHVLIINGTQGMAQLSLAVVHGLVAASRWCVTGLFVCIKLIVRHCTDSTPRARQLSQSSVAHGNSAQIVGRIYSGRNLSMEGRIPGVRHQTDTAAKEGKPLLKPGVSLFKGSADLQASASSVPRARQLSLQRFENARAFYARSDSTPRARQLSLNGYKQGVVNRGARFAAMFVLLSILIPVIAAFLPHNTSPVAPQVAHAAPADTLNFQGRLLTNAGSRVPDGTYHIEFKLYNDTASAGTPDQGACTYGGGTPDPECLWTETRSTGNLVTVQNGYFSVYLGDVTALPNIDWSQALYLGMNIGGASGSPSWDGEMSPRFKLTAVPYAFRAANVASGDTNAVSSDTNDVNVTTGDALGATSDSGSIGIDVGTATGTTGTISLGAANASGVLVGNSSGVTTLAGSSIVLNTSTLSRTAAGTTTLDLVDGGNTTLAITNSGGGVANVTIDGALTVTGLGTFNGGLTVATGSTFTNASSTLFAATGISNLPTGGNIGTAAATVDVATTFDINQTTASQALTLPTPTNTASGRVVYVNNIGSASFTMHGDTVAPGESASFIWNGSSWVATISFTSTGVDTLGAIGSTPNANGASISGTTLTLQPADGTYGGVVTATTQTFAGAKTFNNLITAAAGLTVSSGQNLTLAGVTSCVGLKTDGSGIVGCGANEFTYVVAASDSVNSATANYIGNGDTGAANDGDQVQINLAIAAADAAGGGTVYLLEGTYIIDDTILLENNVTLMGSGTETIIRSAADGGVADNFNMIENSDQSGGNYLLTIQDLTIDGNNTNISASARDTINFVKVGSGVGSGALTGFVIDNVHVINGQTYGIAIDDSRNSRITNSVIRDNGSTNTISISSSDRIQIDGNRIVGGGGAGIVFTTVTNSTINNNIFDTIGASGDRAITLADGSNFNTINGNIIQNTNGIGIEINGSSGSDGNIISNNNITGSTDEAIYLTLAFSTTITGNHLYDNESTGGATDAQILLTGNADENSIIGNFIQDSGGAQSYAINLSGANVDNTYLADNSLITTDGILNTGTNSIFGSQNDGSGNLRLQAHSGDSIELLSETNITGTLSVSSTATFNGNTVIGNANTDTLTINAGTSGSGITLADSSFFNCTALTTSGAGALTCSSATYLTNSLTDNVTDAFDLQEGTNNYININTTNGSENISFGNATTNPSYNFLGSGAFGVAGDATFGGDLTVSDGATVFNGPSAGGSTALVVNAGHANNVGLTINGAASASVNFLQVAGFGESYSSFQVDNAGRTTIRPVTGGDGNALLVRNAAGTTTPFYVDTSTGYTYTYGQIVTGIVDITGATKYSVGGSNTSFTSPQSASISAKLAFDLYNPGSGNQLIALGLPSGADVAARGISLFDNRAAGDNQAILSVFSPDETDVFGLSSDGSNSYGYLKATSGLGLGIKSGTTIAATFETSGDTNLNYDLSVDGTSVLGANQTLAAWGTSGVQLQTTGSTYTDSSTAGSGTATNAVFNSFATPTLAASNSSVTTTNAATVYIQGAPTAGTNQTITNPYAFWVDSGLSRFDSSIVVGDAELGNAAFLGEFQGSTASSIAVTAGDSSSSSAIYLGYEGAETGGGALSFDNSTGLLYLSTNGGSGTVTLDANSTLTVGHATATGELRIADGSSNYVTFNVNALAGDYDISIPTITANDTMCLLVLGNCSGAGREFTAIVGKSGGSNASLNLTAANYIADGEAVAGTGTVDGDQVEINNAIDAVAAAGGGKVLLLEGEYTIDGAIDIDDNVEIIGSGTQATFITISNTTNPGTFSFFTEDSNPENWAIRDLSINMNSSNNTGTLTGITLAGIGTVNARAGIISNIEVYDFNDNSERGITITGGADNLVIENSHFWSGEYAISFTGSGSSTRDGLVIRDNTFEDIDKIGMLISSTTNVTVSGNNFHSFDDDPFSTTVAAILLTSVDSINIYGNMVNNGTQDGVNTTNVITAANITGNNFDTLDGEGVDGQFAYSNITGNTMTNSTDPSGIYLYNTSYTTVSANHVNSGSYTGIRLGDAGANTDNTITGNAIGDTLGEGIYVGTGSVRNVISSNQISNSGLEAISVNAGSNNILGNTIYNYGQNTASSDGIAIKGNSDNNRIVGNHITDTAGSGQAIDIGASADNTYLADNTYSGTGAASINDGGVNTRYANQISAASILQSSSTSITAIANTVLSGTIDPIASASITSSEASGTKFTTELQVGDKITVSGETRTVIAITADNALTVDVAFSNNGPDAAVDRIPAGLTVKTSDASAHALYISDSSGATAAYLSTANAGSANNILVVKGEGDFGNNGEVQVGYNGGAEIRIGNNFYGDDYWTGGTGGYTYTFTPLAYTTGSGAAFAGLTMTQNFAPTSGTNVYSAIASTPTINQTGTAAGITRGLYVNPTLTAFNDFRGLEVNAVSAYTTANNQQGGQITVTDTGNVSSGTDTTLGTSINVTRTGASGGTINNTGLNISVTGDTGGTSTNTGLNVSVTGADTNYAAIFQGGNVGIGDTSPAALLTVGASDAFQVDNSGNVVTNGTLTVNGTGASTIAGPTTIGASGNYGIVTLHMQSADDFSSGLRVRKRGTSGDINGAVASSGELGYHEFYGWNGSAYVRGAYVIARATEAYTGIANGTEYAIATTPNGSTTAVERLTVQQDGNVVLNQDLAVNGDDITSDSNLTINATGYTRIGDTGTPGVANGDDDLYVEGDLEVDGGITLGTDTVTDITGTGLVISGGALGIDTTSASGFFQNGGNAFTAASTLGNTGNYDLNVITNNTTRLTVQADGDLAVDTDTLFVDESANYVGIGTSTPDAKLQIQATTSGENGLHVVSGQSHDTGDVYGILLDLTVSPGADTGGGNFVGNAVNTNIFPSSTIANDSVINFSSNGTFQSTGDLGLIIGYASNFGYYCDPSACGNVDNIFGFVSENPLDGPGVKPTITSNVGVAIEDRTRGTNQTNLLINASGIDYGSVPSGSYSIYNASTKDNVFAGNLRIGSTSAPVATLDVVSTSATGTVGAFTNDSLTTGNGVAISSTGTGLTSGSLLKVTTATTGAVATNGAVSFQASGNYTSTSNVGLLSVQANSTTAGTIQNIQGNALTTGQALYVSSSGTGLTSGSLLYTTSATTGALATNGINSFNATGNYTSTSNAGLLNVTANATTAGTVANFSGNALTTGVGVNIGSTSTGLTTGSLLNVTSATTGAVATNGIVSLNASGNYTSTSNVGLLNVAANATVAGTITNITGNALTTGNALRVSSTGTGLTSGSLLYTTSATTGAVATNGINSFNATGNYTSTSNVGLLSVVANATTAGTIQNIQGNALTTGQALYLSSSSTGLTSGSLLYATSATTGAVATNGIVSLNATGNYTSTSNAGLLNLTANSTTAGTITNIQGTALTTGTALNINAGAGKSVNAVGTAVFQTSTNTTTAFQIQNASSASLFTVDTTNNVLSLLGNNSGEPQAWVANTNTIPAHDNTDNAVIYNGYIYVAGGDNHTTPYSTVAYAKLNADGSTQAWSTTGTLSTAVTYNNSIEANGYLYVLGGSTNAASTNVQSIVQYAKINADGTLGTFTTTSSLPAGRKSGSVLTLNGYMYYIGGDSSSTATPAATKTVYFAKINADGTLGTWANVSNSNAGYVTGAGAYGQNAVAANGYIYVIGGNGVLNLYYARPGSNGDITSNFTVESTNTLPGAAGNYDQGFYYANGYLYNVGGTNASTPQSTVYYAPLNANGSVGTWVQQNTANDLPATRVTFAAGQSNGYFYAIGGYNGGAALTTVYYTSLQRIKAGGNLDLTAYSTGAITDPSGAGSLTAGNTMVVGTLQVQDAATFNDNVNINGNLSVGNGDLYFGSGANRTIGIAKRPDAGTGYNLTLQGGAAGSGNNNGGNLVLSGASGSGSGVKGLVVIDTATYSTAGLQTSGTSTTITQANVDTYGGVLLSATATSVTYTLPDPTQTTVGRVIYVTNAGANDFTLAANTVGTALSITLKPSSTATMFWNGSDWTAAGASSSTDLQAAYNNTAASAGGAEIVLSNTGTKGLTIRNDSSSPIIGGLLEVQNSIGSNLFSVNNNATEYANNGGAENTTFTMWTAAPTAGGTISQYTTAGDNIATGTASVFVDGSSTAGTGVRNTLTTTLTRNLRYRVSFAIRHTSSTSTFSTLDVRYSPSGTNTDVEDCSTGNTINYGQWTRVTCTFIYDNATTPTSSNAILFTHSDATDHDYYIDNLSVTVSADVNHAADGSVEDTGAFATNWVDYDGGAGSTTEGQDNTILYDGTYSASATTTANANQGLRNNMAITPTVSTQYLVTFYARSSNTFSDIRVRYSRDGGTNFVSCTDYNTQSVSTTAFTEITCLFTTDSTTPTNADLIIDQPTGTARTFYVDALSITLNTNNSNNVQIGGGNKGGPVTLFTLDRSAGAPIAANNDAYLGSMYYDTSTGRIQCYEADGWGACGAAPDNVVNLNPEYAGAVLNGSGVGTMTADFCSNDAALSVNSGLCGSGEAKNFYRWTSPQATQQTYSIFVTYQLPETFNGFANDDTVQLVARVDSTSNAAVTYEMFKSTGSAVTRCGTSETDVITGGGGLADTWYSYGINGNEATGCSFTSASAGNFVIFKINMKANSNANAYVSTLSFTTTGR